MTKTIEIEGYDVTIKKTADGFLVSVPDLPGLTMSFRRDEEEKIEPTMREVIMERISIRAKELVDGMVRQRNARVRDAARKLTKIVEKQRKPQPVRQPRKKKLR